MRQPARRLRLVSKARHQAGALAAVEQFVADRLQRDATLDVRIERAIDNAHRADAECRLDLVLA
jgi:hypothetical protein